MLRHLDADPARGNLIVVALLGLFLGFAVLSGEMDNKSTRSGEASGTTEINDVPWSAPVSAFSCSQNRSPRPRPHPRPHRLSLP